MPRGITNGQIWEKRTNRDKVLIWLDKVGASLEEIEDVIRECEKDKEVRLYYLNRWKEECQYDY